MDFNTIAYLIYLPITSLITILVGYMLYTNGRLFILKQLANDVEMTDFINRILLVGYYLINLGYCFWIVGQWKDLKSWTAIMNSLSETLGFILLGLGTMHIINVTILILLGYKKRNQININHKH